MKVKMQKEEDNLCLHHITKGLLKQLTPTANGYPEKYIGGCVSVSVDGMYACAACLSFL